MIKLIRKLRHLFIGGVNSSILKYTEYKNKQALWLQQDFKNHYNKYHNIEQFCILSYLDYLQIAGYDNKENIHKINNYLEVINTHPYMNTVHNKYNKEIAYNINTLIDNVI